MANELKCWPSIVEKFKQLQFEWTRGSITKISKSVLNRGAEGEGTLAYLLKMLLILRGRTDIVHNIGNTIIPLIFTR